MLMRGSGSGGGVVRCVVDIQGGGGGGYAKESVQRLASLQASSVNIFHFPQVQFREFSSPVPQFGLTRKLS